MKAAFRSRRSKEADFKAISLLLFYFALISCPALAQPPPPLRPPGGEIGPSFWEQYHLLSNVEAIVAFLFVVALIVLISRSKPALVISPAAVARRALIALQRRPENDATITEASQILRRYVIFAFNLPSEELTTSELNQKLQSHPGIDPMLLAATSSFFQQCDEDKFSPPALPPHVGAATRALELLDRIEAHLFRNTSKQPVA